MDLSVAQVLSVTRIASATSIWRVIECAKDTRVIELVDFGDGAFDADMPVAARVVSRARAPAAFAARAVQGNKKTCELMRAFFFSEMLERVDAFAVLLGRKRRVVEERGRILQGLNAKVKSPKKSEMRGVVYRESSLDGCVPQRRYSHHATQCRTMQGRATRACRRIRVQGKEAIHGNVHAQVQLLAHDCPGRVRTRMACCELGHCAHAPEAPGRLHLGACCP